MSRRGKSNALIALGLVVMAVGASMALDLPSKVGGDDEVKAEPVTIDTDAAFAALQKFSAKRYKRLLSAPIVLGVPRKQLESIAECESHGNPKSIGGGGLYRGKYQFDRGTWASVGGSGDPAKAPELEQDRRAAMLLKRSGTSPWPVCG